MSDRLSHAYCAFWDGVCRDFVVDNPDRPDQIAAVMEGWDAQGAVIERRPFAEAVELFQP